MSKLILILLFLVSSFAEAQTSYSLKYQIEDLSKFIKNPKVSFNDSTKAVKYLETLVNEAHKKGFLLFSVDSVSFNKSEVTVYGITGIKFNYMQLEINEDDLAFVKKHSRISEKIITKAPISPKEYERLINKLLGVCLNNGHPFAKISLKNQVINNDVLSAELLIDRGKYFRWKKIHIKGDSSVSLKYVSSLLNIKEGDPYSEQRLMKISQLIQQVSFLQEIKPHDVLFTDKGPELYLYFKSNPISSVNGIVGFQPNPISKKIDLTGDLNLKLLNVLKRGESLNIRWQSIRDQTQSLLVNANMPYLFNTPFGIDGNFELYKRDTSFLEMTLTTGVQYNFSQGLYLKGFYQNISSNVLSGGSNNPAFIKLGNVITNAYGLAFSYNKLDYLPNPSSGLSILSKVGLGSRKSRIHDSIPWVKSTTLRGSIKASVFYPITRRHVIHYQGVLEFYQAEEIFENEVFRYGGLKEQRGFNEDELFATTRNSNSIEYRFLLDKNSHVLAFFDWSWYENNTNTYYMDYPFGFGVGFSFSTNLGVFNISYAIGKQLDNQVLLSNSKVHFGYIAYF